MKWLGVSVDCTPSFARPDDDPEWWLWPLVKREERILPHERRYTWIGTLQFLCLRLQLGVAWQASDVEVQRIQSRIDAQRAAREAAAVDGRLNTFHITATPAFCSRTDRKWWVWPLVQHKPSLLRRAARCWRAEELQFQVLFLRLRFVLRGELSARTIAKHRLLDRIPDLAEAA